jgi:hypothetical protein
MPAGRGCMVTTPVCDGARRRNPPPEGAVRCPDVLEGEVSVRLIYVVNLNCPSARQLGIDSAYESDPPEGWTCDGHSGVFVRWRYHLNLQCTDGIR